MYKVLDVNDALFDSENNIATCPTGWGNGTNADNKPTSMTGDSAKATWTIANLDETNTMTVYGFRVVSTHAGRRLHAALPGASGCPLRGCF